MQTMNKHISSTNSMEQDSLRGIIEEMNVIPCNAISHQSKIQDKSEDNSKSETPWAL